MAEPRIPHRAKPKAEELAQEKPSSRPWVLREPSITRYEAKAIAEELKAKKLIWWPKGKKSKPTKVTETYVANVVPESIRPEPPV